MKNIIFSGFFFLLTLSLNSQWKSLKGPYGGSVYNYAIEGASTYIGTTNGLYRSDNDGANWTSLDNGLPDIYEPWSLCVDKDEVFMCYLDSKTNAFEFVYSNDKGSNWIKRPLARPNYKTSEMTYANGLLMVKSDSGLIESNDKGLTWTNSNLGNRVSDIQMIKSNHAHFFVAGYNTIYRRSLTDTAWQLILKTPDYFYTFHVSDSLLMILMDKKPGLRSTNNGLNWEVINLNGISGNQYIADFGDSLYYTDLSFFYKSTDKALTWKLVKPFPNNGLQSLSLLRAGNSLLMNSQIGLMKTNDQFSNFEKSSTGMHSGSSKRMVTTDSFLFVIGELSVERYNFYTKTWNDNAYFSGDNLDDILYYNGVLFALSEFSNNIFISKDNGLTFEARVIKPFSHPIFNRRFLGFDNKILISGVEGIPGTPSIIVSQDSGKTWNYLVMKDGITKADIIPLDMALYNQQVYVIARDNGIYKLYKSQDLVKWESIPVSFQNNISSFAFYELISTEDNLFLIIYPSGAQCSLFKFDPTSSKFIESSGVSDMCGHTNIFKKRIIEKGNRMIFVDMNGYYKSDDSGLTWNNVIDEYGTQFGSVWTDMVLKDNKLYGSTHYWGLLESDWDDVVSSKNLDNNIDHGIIVIPNPNDGEFKIYSPHFGNEEIATVRVYNLQGTSVYNKQEKIYNGFKLQLSGMNPGIYFLKIGNSSKMSCKFVIQN